MSRAFAVIAVAVSCAWMAVHAFPNGSPICDATYDAIKEMSTPDKNVNPKPWAIAATKKNGGLEIRIVPHKGSPSYTGFLLYVVNAKNEHVGTFELTDFAKAVTNENCNDGSTITQVNSDSKTKDTRFLWHGPPGPSKEQLRIKGAVVVELQEWYILDDRKIEWQPAK
ncbi:Reelin domain-containing protein [Plasmodiophora brassicae]|uniref:Reelin domain-containing protein n=1 Tax=Plasmodiophora brassicae TaxID=37360 RepID=A0A0G4IP90_PLABS|nr:hypothetical protein PBRA_005670 [Plasmodiophora brassicae]